MRLVKENDLFETKIIKRKKIPKFHESVSKNHCDAVSGYINQN